MNLKNKILIIFFTFFILFTCFGFLLDVTKPETKADVIICLGGGKLDKITKTINLYKNGYSEKNLVILTSINTINKKDKIDNRITLIENEKRTINYIHYEKSLNTKEEVLYILNYVKLNKINNILIVTDPPHSRRVSVLLNLYKDINLNFTIVSSDVKWWHKTDYFKNIKANSFIFYETIKVVNTFFEYFFFDKTGLLNSIKPDINNLKFKAKNMLNKFILYINK